jgi:predicted RNA-binding protein with PUA-like domain
MAYWLLKSEPDSFSWADQVARGDGGEPWTGVRNHQAKNFLKQMAAGDLAFFYHTSDEKQIVGVVEVMKTAYPDPTDPAWFAVDVVARELFLEYVHVLKLVEGGHCMSGELLHLLHSDIPQLLVACRGPRNR